MNFVEFNQLGTITKSNINNIYATSDNFDKLYIFAEFDTSANSNLEASVTFKRSDGAIVGPFLAEADVVHDRFCRKVNLSNRVLGASGPLQMTVRYQEFDLLDGVPVAIKTRAVGMLTTNVYDAIDADAVINPELIAQVSLLVASKLNQDFRSYDRLTSLSESDMILVNDTLDSGKVKYIEFSDLVNAIKAVL